jgi:hypothetical protein
MEIFTQYYENIQDIHRTLTVLKVQEQRPLGPNSISDNTLHSSSMIYVRIESVIKIDTVLRRQVLLFTSDDTLFNSILRYVFFLKMGWVRPKRGYLLYVSITCDSKCRSRWCNGYNACHWTQGSRIQTRPRPMDFKSDEKPVAQPTSEGK